MRRVKAKLEIDQKGQVVRAIVDGNYYLEDDDINNAKIIDGYILVPTSHKQSRRKGNDLEIKIAKALSMWLYDRPDILKRTPLSGGWGNAKLGDVTVDPGAVKDIKDFVRPNLYVEAKNRVGLLDESFWSWAETGVPKQITDWIKDTKAKAGEDLWFLILKGRGTQPWVLSDLQTLDGIDHTASVFSFFVPPDVWSHRLFMFPLDKINKVIGTPSNKDRIRGTNADSSQH